MLCILMLSVQINLDSCTRRVYRFKFIGTVGRVKLISSWTQILRRIVGRIVHWIVDRIA